MSGLVVGITGGVVALGGMIAGGISGKKAREAAEANAAMANAMAEKQLAFQKVQQAKLDKQKDVYRAMEFKNPYANVKNQFSDMENAYEDLTVNQQQAQFQTQQGAQQRSNIMQGLKGAAGGSGIAGLAQAMASQGQLQNQQISASIGQQESQQQRLKAGEAGRLQQLERTGEQQAEATRLGGEANLQNMEISRQSTLLGISMGESAGANAAAMQAQQNQLSAGAAQANIAGQQAASYYGMAAQGVGMAGAGIAAGADK